MEIFGNVKGLKGAIEKKYSSEIKKVEKEKEKQLADIDKEVKKKLELLRPRMKTIRDAAVKKRYSMVLSREKLKAKKDFEERREELIEEVFKEAEKKAKKIVQGKEYIDYVKKNMPKGKNFLVIGDGDYYKKFFPNLKIDKNIVGLKFELEGVIYDFTLDNMVGAKKDILRHATSKVLFS